MLLNQLLAQLQGGQQNQGSDWQQRMLAQMSGAAPLSPSPIGYGQAAPSPAPQPMAQPRGLGGPNPASAASQGTSSPEARRAAPQSGPVSPSVSTYLTGALQGAAQGRNPLSMLVGGLAGAMGAGQGVQAKNDTYQALAGSGAFTPDEAALAIKNPAAFELISSRKQEAQKRAQAEQQKNATVGFLMKRHGLTAEEAMAIAANPAALVPYLKPQEAGSGGTTYGTTVQWGQDGKAYVIGKDGTAKALDANLMPPDEMAQAKAGGAATGKTLAQAKADLPKTEANASKFLMNLDLIEKDPAFNRMIGPADQWLPNVTAGANRFQSRIDQTMGESFLTAFESLKGGGQITEIEGKKATDAITRLGSMGMDENSYREAINELRQIVKNGVIRARVQAGVLPESALQEVLDLEQYGVPSPTQEPQGRNRPQQPRGAPTAAPVASADGFTVEFE